MKKNIKYDSITQENVTNAGAQSEINRANTISITDLFGVTEREAQSLLISVDRENFIGFTTNNITALRTNINLGQTIKLTLYSRVDFSDSQTYEIKLVHPNNFFTRKTRESYNVASNEVTSYCFTRTDEIGNCVEVYVDNKLGKIIGGRAFGD